MEVKTFTLEELVGDDTVIMLKMQDGVEIRLEKTPDGTLLSYPFGNNLKKIYSGTLIKPRTVIDDNVNTVFKKVQQVIHKVTLAELSDITPEITIMELGADSLDQVEIVMELERKFDITIPDTEAEKLVGEPLEYLVEYLSRS